MAGAETLEIFREIQALVSDKLQVVSYKWLSRNFSVSSNYSKRLLKEFVDTHGNELEVVYTLSGWLKNDPQTYCIKLVSSLNLSDAKEVFNNCSVQVYSVQACIPKDLALLWSAEFVQAEELFDQPSATENCLRDNRFCGVTNPYVKRSVDGKSVSAVQQPKNETEISVRPKTSTILKDPYDSAAQQVSVAKSSAKTGIQSSSMSNSSGKSNRMASIADNQASKPKVIKESINVTHANKNKGKNETSSGGGSSLTSLWGRASTKSKSPGHVMETTRDVPTTAITAEAQICAHEATDAGSSDDEPAIKYKRELNGASNRKRRVVIDFSDEDEEDANVVSLASPGPPAVQPDSDSLHGTGQLLEKKNLSFEDHKEDKVEVKQDKGKERNSGLSGGDTRVGNKNDITGISLQKKAQTHIPKDVEVGDKQASIKITAESTSPKRRKVLKTRIDERGREVTDKPDTHSFTVKPEESGPFPEAVLLKQRVVKEDGREEPEFADVDEEKLFEFLSLQLESSMNLERMRHYEVVYLIHEDCVEEVDSVVSKVQDFVKEKKGRVYRLNNWGLRRLAYKIKKARKANYILMNFELEASCINEFKAMLDRDERIIRHLVIKRDEAITEDCPPPPEFHTTKAGMDDEDEGDEQDDDEFEEGESEDEDGDNIILVGEDEDDEVNDDKRSTRSSKIEKMATRELAGR